MLTTPTSGWDDDFAMLGRWGMKGMGSFESTTVRMKEHPEAMRMTEERKAALALELASEVFPVSPLASTASPSPLA